MKTQRRLAAVMVALLMILAGSNVFSQSGLKGKCMNNTEQKTCRFLPDLTQEQEDQINVLKTQHLKTTLALKNELNEKEARYVTLMTAEKPDMNAINKLIDEIALLKGKIMKEKASHQQEIRKVLTEDQRVLFDQNLTLKGNFGEGKCKSHNKGMGNHKNW